MNSEHPGTGGGRQAIDLLWQFGEFVWLAWPAFFLSLTPGGRAVSFWLRDMPWTLRWTWILGAAVPMLAVFLLADRARRRWVRRRTAG